MADEYKVLLRSEVEPYELIVPLIGEAGCQIAVSYTHLTLPTICSV